MKERDHTNEISNGACAVDVYCSLSFILNVSVLINRNISLQSTQCIMEKYEREVLEFLDEFAENNQIQIANMGIVMALNNYD